MSECYASKSVKCPFYERHEEHRIVCEGLYKGNTLQLVYESSKQRKRYMSFFCNDVKDCQKCRVYNMLANKYDGEWR